VIRVILIVGITANNFTLQGLMSYYTLMNISKKKLNVEKYPKKGALSAIWAKIYTTTWRILHSKQKHKQIQDSCNCLSASQVFFGRNNNRSGVAVKM
jgi:hypothetical protein